MNPTNSTNPTKDIVPEVIEANALIEQGCLLEAENIIESYINSGNKQAFLYLALGDICSELDFIDKAKKHYEAAINIAITEEDNQSRIAAKSGLARIYIQDIWNDFNSLKKFEQIDELLEIIPSCNRSKPFRYLRVLSGPCECASNPGNPGNLDGQWRTIPFPPYKICKKIK
jgi:tetratricopeptide (TPR) repeat protein